MLAEIPDVTPALLVSLVVTFFGMWLLATPAELTLSPVPKPETAATTFSDIWAYIPARFSPLSSLIHVFFLLVS